MLFISPPSLRFVCVCESAYSVTHHNESKQGMPSIQERLLSSSSEAKEYVLGATGCCYTSIVDPRASGSVLIGCKGEQEFLCVEKRYCLASQMPPMDVNIACSPDEICKNRGRTVASLSLYCFELSLKMPTTLIIGNHTAFCFRSAVSFPLAEPVPKPVCAICCLRLLPQPTGFFAPPLGGKPVPVSTVMRRA